MSIPFDGNEVAPPSLGRWSIRDNASRGVAPDFVSMSVDGAVEGAGDQPWEWDLRTGYIRFGAEAPITLAQLLAEVDRADHDRFLRTLNQQLASGGRDHVIEYRVNRGSEVRWVVDRGEIERDATGRAILIRGLRTDINARRLWEESRFGVPPDLAGLGLAVIQSDGVAFGFDTTFGLSVPGFGDLENVIAENERERFARHLRELSHTDFDSEFKLQEGRSVWVRGRSRDGVGRLCFVDLSLSGNAHEALAVERLIRRAADFATDALIIFDVVRNEKGRVSDYVVRHANHQSEAFTQRTVDQILGLPVSKSLDWGRLSRPLALVRGAIHKQEVRSRELMVKNQNGERWFAVRAIPLGDSVALALNDITRQKSTAELIRDQQKLNQRLMNPASDAASFGRQAAELYERAELLTRENETLRDLVAIDELTKVYNRREFENRLRAEVDRVKRYGGDFSVVMIDVDNFKTVNDSHGHAYGDIVLTQFAQTIVGCKREPDLVCRYGGEEFVVILPEVNLDGAVRFAERVREALHAADMGNLRIKVTGSFGCAQHIAGRPGSDVVARADKAQYEAKTTGKDRVCADRVI